MSIFVLSSPKNALLLKAEYRLTKSKKIIFIYPLHKQIIPQNSLKYVSAIFDQLHILYFVDKFDNTLIVVDNLGS